MTHTLGKILWFFTTPSNLLWAMAAFFCLLALLTARRLWAAMTLLSLGLLAGAGLSPLPNWVILPLEYRFPANTAESAGPPVGIIILGGASDPEASAPRLREIELNEAGDRLIEMIALARRYPEAKLIFSGGAGEILGPGVPEADEVARKISHYGLDPARIIFENRSRNTWENAIYSRDLLKPKPGEKWLLVTSAFHMPRSVGVFRQAGFEVIAHPVDFRTGGVGDRRQPFASLSRGLARLDVAAKEWIGLIAYRVMGRLSELFPAP
jgi:uncharacterized SAM-binding protein YcdF (DUF218 family)